MIYSPNQTMTLEYMLDMFAVNAVDCGHNAASLAIREYQTADHEKWARMAVQDARFIERLKNKGSSHGPR